MKTLLVRFVRNGRGEWSAFCRNPGIPRWGEGKTAQSALGDLLTELRDFVADTEAESCAPDVIAEAEAIKNLDIWTPR